ncbi:MAG: hypothetical protein Q8861_01230 [Bacteroidota bacterium]|nr:hypothetical protein [Bacteroidota bacterium]
MSNPQANIYLIGDTSNSHHKNIHHHLISDYSNNANSFAAIYKHFSKANHDYELFCIQRWFVLQEFMIKNGIEDALLLDTDVLIFLEVEGFIKNITKDFQLTRGHNGSMGFVYWKKLSDLTCFCNFVMELYSQKESIAILRKAYEDFVTVSNVGGVSDMTLLDKYIEIHPNSLFNIEIPPLNGQTFVTAFDSPVFKLNKKGFVDISWVKRIPYATTIENERVAVIGIHCYGLQKKYLRKLYQGKHKILCRIVYYWKTSYVKVLADILRGRKFNS